MSFLKFILISAAALLVLMGAASARQDDQRLVPLFVDLSQATSRPDARPIEQDIWKIWLSSGSETLDLLMFQGMEQMSRGGFKQAMLLFTSIIEMDPDFAEAWNKRATVRFLVGDLDGSIEDVARTLELEPRHFGALAGLGQIYERKKADDQALSAFEKALKLNPQMPFITQKIRRLQKEISDKNI